MSASSVGAVVVAVPLAARADAPGAWRLMIISGCVFGVGVMALGAAPWFWLTVLVTMVLGAGTTGYQSLSNTIALSMTEDSHRGRVQSLMMLSFAGFGIAAAPLGFLAEAIGLRQAIELMGIITLAGVLIYAALEYRLHRQHDDGPEHRVVASATGGD